MIALDYPRKDGTRLRDHISSDQYIRMFGWDKRLDPPDLPPELAYLWNWFWQVVNGMGETGFWVTLDSWSRNIGVRPDPWEVDVMYQLHLEYSRAVSAKMKEK